MGKVKNGPLCPADAGFRGKKVINVGSTRPTAITPIVASLVRFGRLIGCELRGSIYFSFYLHKTQEETISSAQKAACLESRFLPWHGGVVLWSRGEALDCGEAYVS
jgi:hypothetical protein